MKGWKLLEELADEDALRDGHVLLRRAVILEMLCSQYDKRVPKPSAWGRLLSEVRTHLRRCQSLPASAVKAGEVVEELKHAAVARRALRLLYEDKNGKLH